MINPLARVVMQNVTRTTTDKRCDGNRLDVKRTKTINTRSLDDLAKGLKAGGEPLASPVERPSGDTKAIKTMSFSDMARQAKGEKIEPKTDYKFKQDRTNVRDAKSLADLARNVKGQEVRDGSRGSSDGETKTFKFNDLVGEKTSWNSRETKATEVEDYIDSKDKTLISNVISGKSNAEEKTVKATKVLNLSQAVSNIINR